MLHFELRKIFFGKRPKSERGEETQTVEIKATQKTQSKRGGTGMEFTTPTKVAKQLGTSSETIRTLCRKGELPAYRIGGHFRIPMQEYERWLEAQRITPTEQSRVEEPAKASLAVRPLRFNNLPGFEI